MYRHIVLFKSENKNLVNQCCSEVVSNQKSIEGLLHAEYANNISNYSEGYDQIAIMEFGDKKSLDKWSEHPLHQTIMERLAPDTALISFDYEVVK